MNGGRILQEAEKWGEYTWAKEKMGRVLLREGKNGGVYLGEEKNGGSTYMRPKVAAL